MRAWRQDVGPLAEVVDFSRDPRGGTVTTTEATSAGPTGP